MHTMEKYIAHYNVMKNSRMQAFMQQEENLAGVLAKSWTQDTVIPIPLPFGYCTNSSEFCEDSVLCYHCSMFSADSIQLQAQLDYAEKLAYEIERAKMDGRERTAELLEKVLDSVKKVLQSIHHESGNATPHSAS